MLAHDLYCCPTSNIKNVFKSLYLAQHCSISEEGERARESVSLHLRRFHLWRSGGGGGSNQEDGKLFCLLLPLLFLGKGAGRERNGLEEEGREKQFQPPPPPRPPPLPPPLRAWREIEENEKWWRGARVLHSSVLLSPFLLHILSPSSLVYYMR